MRRTANFNGRLVGEPPRSVEENGDNGEEEEDHYKFNRHHLPTAVVLQIQSLQILPTAVVLRFNRHRLHFHTPSIAAILHPTPSSSS
uniref:Uncharacterized protein n=1 Tax=Cucumis melo TaxID=3656 RepID=A0A9I9DKL8_CUCME